MGQLVVFVMQCIFKNSHGLEDGNSIMQQHLGDMYMMYMSPRVYSSKCTGLHSVWLSACLCIGGVDRCKIVES